MKGTWFLVGLGAAVVGFWWWARRSAAGLPLIPVEWGNPFGPLVADLGRPQSPVPTAYLPPVVPDPGAGANWRTTAGQIGGVAGAAAASAGCVAVGGGPLCVAAAPIGKVAGQIVTTGAIKVGEYTVSGAKAVGSAAKTGLKAIVPFW